MEQLEKKLKAISDLIKAAIPSPKPIIAPQAPIMPTAIPKVANPTITPKSTKDPLKIAQQIKNPKVKKEAVSQAKEVMKFDNNGQWTIS